MATDYTKGYNGLTDPPPTAGHTSEYVSFGADRAEVMEEGSRLVTSVVVGTYDNDQEMGMIYNRAKGVRWLACIDLFMAFINMFIIVGTGDDFWAAYIVGLFALSGFYGAKKYNSKLLFLYIIYRMFFILGNIYVGYTSDQTQITVVSYVVAAFGVYFLQYVVKLSHLIGNVSDEKLTELRTGWVPGVLSVYIF